MMQRWAGIGVLGALVLYLHLVPLQSQLEINADSERDLFRANGLIEQGIWPAQGPAIDFLPISLGPGWYLASAPALGVDPSPYSVHVLHILVLVVGLFLVYRALCHHMSAWGALMTCLLLGTSHHMAQVTVRLWHNALLPGIALIWFWALHQILRSADANRRARGLLIAWLVTALMLQLHVVSVAYALPLALLHVHLWRRDGWAAGKWAIGAAVIPALLLVGYTTLVAGLNWDHVAALQSERAAGGIALGDMLTRLPEHLWSGWSSPGVHWLAGVILLGAAWGAIQITRSARSTWTIAHWTLLQVLVGILAVATLSGLHPEARYYNGLVPGLYILAGFGLAHALREGKQQVQAFSWVGPLGVALTVVVVFWGGWLGWPEAMNEEDTPFELSLNEQEAVLDHLQQEYNLSFADLNTRVHGPVFGALAAPRYLAHIRGMTTSTSKATLEDGLDLLVVPRGYPVTRSSKDEQSIDGGSGRSLAIRTIRRQYEPTDVAIRYRGQLCDIALPYHWSHLPNDELTPFGFPPSPGLESCSQGEALDAPLEVTIASSERDETLVLVLGWFDVRRDHVENTWVEIETAEGQWSRLTPVKAAQSMALYRFPAQTTTLPIRWRVHPIQSLAVIDLY